MLRKFERTSSRTYLLQAARPNPYSFSDLVESKYGGYSEYQQVQEINLSYEYFPRLCPLQPRFQSILTLSLNHCDLQSLQGIEQFSQVHTVSLKYNNLTNFREVFKISRSSLVSLDITGNEIQYTVYTRYDKLVTWFTRLRELNGTDYKLQQLMNHNALTFRGNDAPDSITLFKKLQDIHRSVQTATAKTLNTQMGASQSMMSKSKTVQEEEQQTNRQTAKKNCSFQQADQPSPAARHIGGPARDYYYDAGHNDNEDEDKQNLGLLNNISLSRVQMVKSVMRNDDDQFNLSQLQPSNIKGRRNLLIETNKAENIQVMQPTATFARQKEVVVEKNRFQFKREDSICDIVEQQEPDDYLPTHHYLHSQNSVMMGASRMAASHVAVEGQVYDLFQDWKQDAADANYYKSLMQRAFKNLRLAKKKHNNMPRQKKFF